MTLITNPDAYLAPPENAQEEENHKMVAQYLKVMPPGASLPLGLRVEVVDSPMMEPTIINIAGTVTTVVHLSDGTIIAVFSTGERVAVRYRVE